MDYKKMLIATYDATVEDYAPHEFENPIMVKHYDKFTSLLPEKAKILDVGCGPGQAAKNFAEKGHDVIAIDLSKSMIEYAKKHVPNVPFYLMDVENITLNQKFDGIWAAFVLCQVEKNKHQSIIKKFYEMLNLNGIFFLGMMEGEGEKVMPEPYNRKYNQYFVFTSQEEIERYFKNTGFKILNYSTEEFNEEGDIFTLSFTYAKK